MKQNAWGTGVLGCLLMAGAVWSQTIDGTDNNGWKSRSFLLQVNSQVVTENGYYGENSNQYQYAKAHPGSYIVFAQAGTLYRLDTPAVVADANDHYIPLRELAYVQEDLSAAQRPLSEQQSALAAQMRGAVGPTEMSRIGHAQGLIGRRQGEIGREQGVIGRQQGVLGKLFNQVVQSSIDTCLKDGSCKPV